MEKIKVELKIYKLTFSVDHLVVFHAKSELKVFPTLPELYFHCIDYTKSIPFPVPELLL